jgi:putative ABC transport system permease protein
MPDWAEAIRARISALNLEPAREAEVVEELDQHLRDRHDELLAAGLRVEEASKVLMQELNDGKLISGLKVSLHSAKPPLPIGKNGSERLLGGIGSDLRFGARLLFKNPGFAMVAILSLALGIGANTAIFQLLDAVRLRTLPVKAPNELATVGIVDSPHCCVGNHYSNHAQLTGGLWNLVREQQQGFAKIAAWAPTRHTLGQGGEAHYVNTLMVSGDFFEVLGVRPALGRLISVADDNRGCGAQGAVLSYAFWQRQFGGGSDVLAKQVTLSGHPLQIIGVTPSSFYGIEVGQNFDVAIAMCSEPVFSTKGALMDSPISWWIATIARLKPGWTIERASAQLAAISSGIFTATVPSEYDAIARKDYLSFHLGALPAATGVSSLRSQYEDPLWLLLALSGLVLLIACANLANLMLARASARQREMALRLALGASRSRLIRQLLAESSLLVILGTVGGLGLARTLSRVLIAFLSTEQNRIFMELTLDWRVLGFATGLALLTCLLFGLTPAIQASRTEPGVAMKANARGTTAGRDRFLLRRTLVVGQVALSLVLLAGAFLFVRTFRNLLTLNAGFRQDHILVTDFDFSPLKLPPESQMAYKHELIGRVQAVSGVSSAAEVLLVPMGHSGWDNNVDFPDGPQRQDLTFNRVSPGYFRTMETPFLAGRDFNDADTPRSPRVAIVSEALARKFFAGTNPVGRVFHDAGEPDKTYQIIGVVKDTKYYELREEPVAIIFVSFTQANGPEEHSTLVIRSDQALLPLISSIKRTANDMNPAMVLNFNIFKTQIREGLLRERLMATLSGFFGTLAAVLAMVGLYGVISFMVIRRRSEIGIRMALGANRNNILLMVLQEAAVLLGIGLAVGTGLTLAVGVAARSMLYGLKPSDPFTLGAASAAMAVVALAASLLPARRAATADPLAALRED